MNKINGSEGETGRASFPIRFQERFRMSLKTLTKTQIRGKQKELNKRKPRETV